ncbi:uncharacterized protein LOC122961180 [Acropora millepora]|uniref:uncharacterized protein LOC122961180 n=1 Tax=Acropora millepora TaxID=45264 RepID=UPI001CF29379|nr:uncharacterized protein LOC122961180 [Acropora millepora]
MKTTQGCFFNGGPTPIIDSYNENPQDASMKTSQGCFSGSYPSGPPLVHGTLKPAKDVSFETSKQFPVMNSCSRYLTLTHLLPYPAEGVEVVYTTDPIEVEAWLRNNVIDCSAQAIGLDIEWKPQLKPKKDGGIENKTAVLQLAIESSCLVFQLYNLGRPPNDLVSVLKDERILKVGSGILQDVTKLKKDTGLKCIGLVDTQKLAKEVGMLESQKLGLKSLAKYLLGIELEKPKLVTRSNWENFPLTVKQIHYAALDAWIGLKIYRSMKTMQGKSTCKSLEGSNLVNCEEATMNENSNLVNCEEATMNENSTLVNCEEATMNENPLACHVCGKKFKTSSALSEHLKVHPKCRCGQYFVDKISKNHRKNCPLLNPFSCHVCGRKVKTNSALSKHLKVHGKCQCGQYFVGKIPKKHRMKCLKLKQWGETILKHIKINSDEPGLCNACGKKCATLESLTRHIRKAAHVLCPFCTDLLPFDASPSHILKCQDLTGKYHTLAPSLNAARFMYLCCHPQSLPRELVTCAVIVLERCFWFQWTCRFNVDSKTVLNIQKPLIMRRIGEQKRGSSIQSPIGLERASEYLLRRKAEGITGRIHNERSLNHPSKTYIPLCSTGVEEPERSREPCKRSVSGFPIEACVSSSSAHCSGLAVVPNEGFWLDRTGSRQDQRNSLSSHSVYGKHTSSGNRTHNNQRKDFIMGSLEVKSMQINAEGLHSNVNHAKHTSAEQQTEEALNLTCYYHGENHLKNSFQQFPCHQDLIPRVSNNKINGGPTPIEDSYQYNENRCFFNGGPTPIIDSYNENPQDASMKTSQGCFFNGGPTPIIDSYNENPQDASMKTSQGCFSGSHPSGPPLAHGTLKSAKDVSFKPSKQIPVVSSCNRYLTLTHLLPYPAEGVEVVYTTDPIEVEAWLRNNVIDCSAQAIGLDIEWKPQFKRKKDGGVENKTAVLQLAIESSSLVFQLYNLGRPPNVLVSVLKDERILKVGSGILQDVTKLKKDTGLKCIGLVDTQKLAKEVGMLESQKLGLKSLAKYLLGIELEKPKSVTMSNWENFPLTVKQIHYAALDAWIGLKIYQSMKTMQRKSTCKSLEGSNLVNCEEATMNENPLPCHVCGKKFKTSSALPEHLKVHPKCRCGQYFVDKISKKHKKKCPFLNPFVAISVGKNM